LYLVYTCSLAVSSGSLVVRKPSSPNLHLKPPACPLCHSSSGPPPPSLTAHQEREKRHNTDKSHTDGVERTRQIKPPAQPFSFLSLFESCTGIDVDGDGQVTTCNERPPTIKKTKKGANTKLKRTHVLLACPRANHPSHGSGVRRVM